LALWNSKAAIEEAVVEEAVIEKVSIRKGCDPKRLQSGLNTKYVQHWPQAQIFDENAGLGRNTVNACFPGRSRGRRQRPANRSIVGRRHSTIGEAAHVFAGSNAQLSALRKPCH
jgi:hypothetical protein